MNIINNITMNTFHRISIMPSMSDVWSYQTHILFALFVLFLTYLITTRSRKTYPPGPTGWPIVGYLPYLSEDSHLDFMVLGKKYGDVFSVQLGKETVVVLHGSGAIQEAFGKSEFLGRPSTGALKLFLEGSAFFDGDDIHKWNEHRKFVLQSLKDLGLGKTQLEVNIMAEIRHFLDILKSHEGRPMDPKKPLSCSISNNICTLVLGKRYEYEDPEGLQLQSYLETAVEVFIQTSFVAFFPWMLRIPYVKKLIGIEKGMMAVKNMKSFFRKEIEKHKNALDRTATRDFMDTFIVEMERRRKKDPRTTLSEESLTCDAFDLFSAGSETTRNSILWCLYIAAAFPDAQERVRQEILEVMGPDRDPEFQDMKSMPCTHSFLLEVMRWKTLIPIIIPHYTVADTTVGGYAIPKGTTVLAHLWNAHQSPKYWSEPESFIPERFITEDGKSISKPSHFMPFSMGKRICPGEHMAVMEMFLYFASILQKFRVLFPEGYVPTFKATFRGSYIPDSYKMRFLTRN